MKNHSPADEIWLRDVDVAARYDISRKSVWDWTRLGRIPAPVRLGPATARWRLSALAEWETSQEGAA